MMWKLTVKANCQTRKFDGIKSEHVMPCSFVGRHMLVPMARYVNAAGDPHLVAAADVIDESLKRQGAAGPAGETAVKADRHHLGRAASSFLVEEVESCRADRRRTDRPS